ncbi:MAG: YlxR family protein [Candidatus Rokubacteria bacterium]|nr:YlxR family protein [Candidatus Rokubacteria bacterium]
MTREPSRTCLGCRQVRARRALVRLVRRSDGVVVADPHGTAAGRGAWVCPEESCLERALQPGRLAHAFRKPCEAGKNLSEEVRGLWPQR